VSIQSEISRISGNVADALDAIEAKGVTVPTGSNSDDLATLIAAIPGGGYTKFTSGTKSLSNTGTAGSNRTTDFIISGLAFEPKMVLIFSSQGNGSSTSYIKAIFHDADGERTYATPYGNAAQISSNLPTFTITSSSVRMVSGSSVRFYGSPSIFYAIWG
jgi:hypothetical protein